MAGKLLFGAKLNPDFGALVLALNLNPQYHDIFWSSSEDGADPLLEGAPSGEKRRLGTIKIREYHGAV